MQTINYPLLYFEMENESTYGMLVGTDYQAVDKNLRSVKNSINQHLQRDYKKFDYYPNLEIIEPRLKIIKVSVRPTYKEKTGSFPMSSTVSVPIPIVYGETQSNYFECYLPLFGESFYYYNSKEQETLVKHFVVNIFSQMRPEEINRYLTYPKPELDTIRLRVKERNTFSWENTQRRQYEKLNRLAEKYPYTKATRRNISAFPEAAWELEDVVDTTVEKIKNLRANVLIVGNHGVGKSAVIKQALKKIETLNKKEDSPLTFWRIMAQRFTATAKYFGEWQEACEELIEELTASNGVLWVIDMIRLLQVGGSGTEDSVAAFITSFLEQGKMQMIGEVTKGELDSMRRLLPNFVQNFQIIHLEELPETKIQSILRKFADYSEKNLKISLQQEAIEMAYRLLHRYYPYENFPGKAIKFLSQCVSEAEINEITTISNKEIISNFNKQTGLPELFLRDEMLLDTKELRTFFQSKIIGQEAAITQLTGVVKVFKAGLNNPYKPITTLIFAGPTGVGKTASAKALADYFFGKGQKHTPLIRIDMSEFQHPSQITRFIGSSGEVGKLVQDIREKPFSVLLLDEVEKADSSIFDALLTVLDEGMLVDNFGRVTNFRNTIIIMTSNLGASNLQSIGFNDLEDEEAKYMSAISKYFRPEFVNRIDGVVMFNSLKGKDIKKITEKELEDLKKREGFVKLGLELEFTKKLIDHIASIGFDEKYGARPLQRAIERNVVAPMANWLLENPKLKNKKLKIDYHKKLIVKVV